MIKKIVTISLVGALMLGFSGCSSKEVTIENKQPEKYEVLGKAAYNGEFEQCFQKYLNTFDKNIF